MGSKDGSEVMGYIMGIIQEGKVDPFAEGLALLHAMGMKVDESSLINLMESSAGQKASSGEKKAAAAVIGLYNEMGFDDNIKKVLAPAKKGYKNPLAAKAPEYNDESLKIGVDQYSMFIMLGMAASAFKQFKAMIEAMEKSMGPGKETSPPMKKPIIDFLNKYGVRESFDPYMHATILCYGLKKEISPANVVPVLDSLGVKADPKRLEKTCELVSKADMPELVKAQIAYLKALGE
ncbi:MAG: hypothetical protein ABII22_07210 [Candidatus Micrarchaeota archaeon]